jgi:hypothetical protein
MSAIPAPNIGELQQNQEQINQNALAEYTRAAQEKAQTAAIAQQTQQQTALAPGQVQLQQQQIQAQAQQLADQKALTAAWSQYDPSKNTKDDPLGQQQIQALILKNGGSGAQAQQAQQHFLQLKDTASQIAERDANTGTKTLANMKARNDSALGIIQSAENVPDDQLPQHLSDALDDAERQGVLDPQHLNNGRQLLGLPPDQIRTQLKAFENSLQTHSQIFDEAQKAQKTEQENWKPAGPGTLINIKTGETKQGSLPVDQAEMHSYLTTPNVPGESLPPEQRTPASFVAWKAKQSPMAMVLGNQLGQGNALDQAAERYSTDGTLPSGFARSPGTLSAIIQRAAQLHPDQNIAANKATYQSDTAALKQVQKQFDTMNAFEGTALKNLDLYAQTAAKIPDLGAKFANVPLRMITGGMIGTDNMAALNAARQTASSEVAKVLSSATGSGVLSDTQKKEAQDVIDGNLPLSATVAVVNTLKQDMANRHQSYQQDIAAIQGRLGFKPQTQQQGGQTQGNDFFSKFGGKPRSQ